MTDAPSVLPISDQIKIKTPRGLPVPAHLDALTALLVENFAVALAEKLAEAQVKHGFENHWRETGWQGDLIVQLLDHVRKGDPRDVAAYCAFAWHHGWSIAPVVPVVSGDVYVVARQERADFAAELATARALRSDRQQQVYDWAWRCFGMAHATDPRQRGLRMLEEAVELYQAVDGDQAKAHELVDFVFSRPKGEVGQELGGLGVTILALAAAVGKDANAEEAAEVARILSKSPEHFAARNAAKNAAGFDFTAPAQFAGGSMAWWFKDQQSDYWVQAEARTESDAALEGRAYYEDGRPFQVAQGEACGAWPNLFDGGQDLAEFINDRHEDQSNEEPFTVEAGISDEAMEVLCAEMNAVWGRFINRERPKGNKLNLKPPAFVFATEEWTEAQGVEATQTTTGAA